jgi:hypothetical protein
VHPRLSLRRRRAGAPWRHGDEAAARRTHELLERLDRREWTVLADVDPRHGVDHVLVGPGGVFAVASRKPETAGAHARDGVLWLPRGGRTGERPGDTRAQRPEVEINREILATAHDLHREIRRRTGRGPAVEAVVALWCEFPQGVAESTQIAFVHGRNLRTWLLEHPPRLDEEGRRAVVQALRDATGMGPGMETPHAA